MTGKLEVLFELGLVLELAENVEDWLQLHRTRSKPGGLYTPPIALQRPDPATLSPSHAEAMKPRRHGPKYWYRAGSLHDVSIDVLTPQATTDFPSINPEASPSAPLRSLVIPSEVGSNGFIYDLFEGHVLLQRQPFNLPIQLLFQYNGSSQIFQSAKPPGAKAYINMLLCQNILFD
jgi:hypothetical protein